MKNILPATQAALEARTLIVRDFIRITARERATGDFITEGYWNGVTPTNAEVVDGDTGEIAAYDFVGVGSLIQMSAIPMVCDLTVQTVTLKFSQIEDRINDLIRNYDVSQGKVEIYRGEFDPATMRMIEPATPRFLGFADGAPIKTPPEGGEGSVSLVCVSSAQELTRSNPDMRSHESQQLRAPGDDFYKDVTKVGEIEIVWGDKSTGLDIE